MVNYSKDKRISDMVDALQKQGWLKQIDISDVPLTSENIEHFRNALLKVEYLLEWLFSTEDKYGTHPNDSAMLVQTISRLNAELGRLEGNVQSNLFDIDFRINKKGADPVIRDLTVSLGLFHRHFRSEFASENKLNDYLSGLLLRGKYQKSISQVGNYIKRFQKGVAGELGQHQWGAVDEFKVSEREKVLEILSRKSDRRAALEREILRDAKRAAKLMI